VNSRAPHCWLLLLLLLLAAVQADGQTAHWLHGENDSCECLHVCFLQSEKQPKTFPLAIFTNSVWMPKEGHEGDVRGGGLFMELHARAPHGPLHHSLAPCLCLLLPLPAP
jgi:hypothetical protein